jgi:hypothetical protein
MSQTEQRRDRSGDLSWAMSSEALAKRVAHQCYICGRPNASSSTILGGNTAGGGTKVPRCAEGVGCRDGRVYHGPLGMPHWSNEPCEICARSSDPAVRRLAGNAPKNPGTGTNRSPHHR